MKEQRHLSEKQLRTLLFSVAITEPYMGDDGLHHCPHCRWERQLYSVFYEDVLHETRCVVRQARLLLSEMGTPISLYSYTWQRSGDGTEWKPSYTILLYCYTEDEVKVQARKDMNNDRKHFQQYNPHFRCKDVRLRRIRSLA